MEEQAEAMRTWSRSRWLTPAALLLPGALLFLGLIVLPFAELAIESFRPFTPGRIGSVEGAPWTLENYRQLLEPSFLVRVYDTLGISLLAAVLSVALSYPLAYLVVRRMTPGWRSGTIAVLVLLVLLSVLMRTYALELTLGSVTPFRPLLAALGIEPNSRSYIEALVLLGLLQASIPISTLLLLNTIQSVDPALEDAAKSLGAPGWKTHLAVTLPLSVPGLIAAFLVALATSLSSFVIPMILGKGRVMFVSNTIYSRFSDVANYPSGAAASMFMLAVCIVVVLLASSLAGRRGAAR